MNAAQDETTTADDAWRSLANDTAYILPFHDRMRLAPLGYDPFHWKAEVPALAADASAEAPPPS